MFDTLEIHQTIRGIIETKKKRVIVVRKKEEFNPLYAKNFFYDRNINFPVCECTLLRV